MCIDGKFQAWVALLYKQLPIKGQVYTVRAVCLRREKLNSSDEATIALLLAEVVNPPDPTSKDGCELAFREERFSPLLEVMGVAEVVNQKKETVEV